MNHSYDMEHSEYSATTVPAVRSLKAHAAFNWLKLGLDDFLSAPLLSLSYGLLFVLAGTGLGYAATLQPKLSLTFLVAMLMIGPLLATGLYVIARQNETGEAFSLAKHLRTLIDHKGRLAVYLLTMLLLTVAWIRLFSLIVAVYYGQLSIDISVFSTALSSAEGWRVIAPLAVVGLLFAFLIFAASALSLPMIVDGKREMIPALIASLQTVVKQPGAMLVWAGLIFTLTAIGIATLLIGLLIIFPVLGYATWYSYRDMQR
ncbi:MAG: DUF2189 domain-containing protein [Thioalkalispiraceae bacterium]|jgi:uncharacterized membrane protein